MARKARRRALNSRQLQLVVGSLLGDGYLMKTTNGYSFRINHSIAQKEYVDWKYEILAEFVRTSPRSAGRCYYFRTISHPIFKEIRKYFFKRGKRKLSGKFLERHVSPFVLAVWIMDDGSKDGNQLRINTQCFDRKDNNMLRQILRAKLGIATTMNRDKDRYRIRVKSESMDRVVKLIAPFVIPSMFYKLPL
jgi:hypothetical protein